MLYFELHRDRATDKQILGTLKVKLFVMILRWHCNFTVFTCKTLELAWRQNKQNISCIPAKVYDVFKRVSTKNGKCFELTEVPGRSHIQIHILNTYHQTQGCIGVGAGYSDIDADGYMDVIDSAKTLNRLYKLMPQRTFIRIIDGKGIDTNNFG